MNTTRRKYYYKTRPRFTTFPSSKYPTINSLPMGAVVSDGTGELKQKVQCFVNSGTDYINAGRPQNFIDQIVPRVNEFSFRARFSTTSTEIGYVFSISGSSGGLARSLGLRVNNSSGDNRLLVNSLGILNGTLTGQLTDLLDGKVKDVLVKCTLTEARIFYNSQLVTTFTHGTAEMVTEPLRIGTIHESPSSLLNFQGTIYSLQFFSGVGDIDSASLEGLTLLDSYDLTNNQQWNGSAVGVSQMGNPFTVTDGAPTTAFGQDLIPISQRI